MVPAACLALIAVEAVEIIVILALMEIRKILSSDVVSETPVNFMLEFFVYNLANSLNKNKAGFRPLYLIPVITVEIKYPKK
jgi:hypothetical protein